MTGGCQCRPTDPACGCGAVWPGAVVLTEQERDQLAPFIWGGWIGVPSDKHAAYSRELRATVERIIAARVAAERERADAFRRAVERLSREWGITEFPDERTAMIMRADLLRMLEAAALADTGGPT